MSKQCLKATQIKPEMGVSFERHNQPWGASRVINKSNKLNIHCPNTSKQWQGRAK
jgi:hypothetical protein